MNKTEKVIVNYTSGKVREIISKKSMWIAENIMCCTLNNANTDIIIPMNNVESIEIKEM